MAVGLCVAKWVLYWVGCMVGAILSSAGLPSSSRCPTRRSLCSLPRAPQSGILPPHTVSAALGLGEDDALGHCYWLTHLAHALSPGMTMEMVGTLMGATVHGFIVSGAHRSNHCEDTELPVPAAVSPDAVSVQAARTPSAVSPPSSRATSLPHLVSSSLGRGLTAPSFLLCSPS